MMRFLETHALSLTPLTPIHIGCGEDFEPTNYVIDEGLLFHFEPASVLLDTDNRRKLMEAVGTGGQDAIRRVQKFFFERREMFAAFSRGAIAVAPGIAEQYASRIAQIAEYGADGQGVINVLEIERTAHHPHTGLPYIPGSSIKGAIRTAWLNRINNRRPREPNENAMQLEKRLLQGSFQTDPFRLIRVADAAGSDIASRILFSTNHKKAQVFDQEGRPRQAQGPTTRRETIFGGQYRRLASELRVDSLGGLLFVDKTPTGSSRIGGFPILADACNRFYRARLDDELGILEGRGLASPDWIKGLRDLIDRARPALDGGTAMLLRVGRHSGAESVTIEGVRSIRIMKKRGDPPDWSSSATTVWLAAEREDARSGMQPFGWLLVEPADAPEIPGLKGWCDAQPKPDLAVVSERQQAARVKVEADLARQRQLAQERKSREEDEARAVTEAAQRLASMSEQGRMIERLRENLEKHTGRKQAVSDALYAETRNLIKSALESDWSPTDKRELADLVAELGFQKIEFGGREKEIKRNLRALRGEP